MTFAVALTALPPVVHLYYPEEFTGVFSKLSG